MRWGLGKCRKAKKKASIKAKNQGWKTRRHHHKKKVDLNVKGKPRITREKM